MTLEKNNDGDYVLGNVNFTQLKQNAGPGEVDEYEISPFSIIITNNYFEVIYTKFLGEREGVQSPNELFLYSGNFNSSTVTENWIHSGTSYLTFASGWDDTYYKNTAIQGLQKVF